MEAIVFYLLMLQKYINCYPFIVKLDRCVGSCNTVNDLSNKICVPNKTANLNLTVFNMITGIENINKAYIIRM